MFALIAFKVKVLIVLKMIQRFNYQLAKQNLTGLWDKNYAYYFFFTDFVVKICLQAQKVTRPFLSPPQRLPLGIPIKISITEKIESARGTMASCPARSLFLSPQPPHNTKRPLRRRDRPFEKCASGYLTENFWQSCCELLPVRELRSTFLKNTECSRCFFFLLFLFFVFL